MLGVIQLQNYLDTEHLTICHATELESREVNGSLVPMPKVHTLRKAEEEGYLLG